MSERRAVPSMKPTIGSIIALAVVQAGQPEVIGGGTLDRPVRWVHVSDLPDLSNLLQGGELVLTTGQSLGTTPSMYLEGLAAAGAAGVIVELGDRIRHIDPQIARAADRLQLPVIALHKQIRFVDVTEAVHRSIVAAQYDEVDFARKAHELFTDLSMKRASIAEIVDAAATMLDAAVILEDLTRQVLAVGALNTSAADLLGDWERRSRLTPISHETAISGPELWTTTPVGAHRQEWGRLVVPRHGVSEVRARMVLERAAQALALHRMVEQDRSALEQQAQSGLVDDMRRGRISDEAEATARAYALGLKPGLTYLPVTIRIKERRGADAVLDQRSRANVLDAVRHAVRVSRHTALAASPRSERIDLLLSQPPAVSASDALHAVCTSIRNALSRLNCGDCVIGVAPGSTKILDAALDLTESAHIAEVAMAMTPDDKLFHQGTDIRLRGLLALLRSDPRLQSFAETEVGKLLDHRALHGSDLFDLLRRFLELGGNKTELAKEMQMSRPTLYSKLARIERILGVSLDDAESRTSLHVAVLVTDTASKNETDVSR